MDLNARVDVKHLKQMNSQIKAAFDVVKSELEDHRESINENTNEIQSLYEYLSELDQKLQKIDERLDEINFAITGAQKVEAKVGKLTLREKEVALVLYMEDKAQNVDALAKRTGLTSDLVLNYIDGLRSKGVPVVSHLVNNDSLFSLSREFRDLQAKDNVLKIGEAITEGLQY